MATASRTRTLAVTAEPDRNVRYHRGSGWPSSRLLPLTMSASEEMWLAAGLAALVRRERSAER